MLNPKIGIAIRRLIELSELQQERGDESLIREFDAILDTPGVADRLGEYVKIEWQTAA